MAWTQASRDAAKLTRAAHAKAKTPKPAKVKLSKEANWAKADAERAAKPKKMSKALATAHAKARATRSFFGT